MGVIGDKLKEAGIVADDSGWGHPAPPVTSAPPTEPTIDKRPYHGSVEYGWKDTELQKPGPTPSLGTLNDLWADVTNAMDKLGDKLADDYVHRRALQDYTDEELIAELYRRHNQANDGR